MGPFIKYQTIIDRNKYRRGYSHFVAKPCRAHISARRGELGCPARSNAQTGSKIRCEPLKTVSGPYLSSPDELESIYMRFRKRRSPLTTSELQLGRVSDASTVNFAFPCPAATVPAPSRTELHSDLTNCI